MGENGISEEFQEQLKELNAQSVLAKYYRLDELNQIICDCEDEIEVYIKSNNIKTVSDNTNYLLETLGKCFVSIREIIALCKNGFPDGALSIARNVYEQFIITTFVESKTTDSDFNALLERYDDDYDLQRAKALKYEAQYVLKDSVEQGKQKAIIDGIKQKHGVNGNPRDYWWAREGNGDFSSLCEYVVKHKKGEEMLIHTMRLMYKRACMALHASNIGNKLRLGSNSNAIEMGPWVTGQESSLFLSSASLRYILLEALPLWKIEANDIITKLEELILFYDELMRKEATNDAEE